jgi:iron complex outermembrane recepter protein
LRETIVVRSTDAGADYFVNAGTTSQKGIESTISWTPTMASKDVELFRLWMSYTYNDYQFLDYVSGANDLSGNKLTGVPPTVVVSGVDLTLKKGWYANISLNYTDHIPVNDGNTEYAREYKILSARIENLLDEKYSLGNDLNAAGNRYYNLAPGRNFYGGVTIPLAFDL